MLSSICKVSHYILYIQVLIFFVQVRHVFDIQYYVFPVGCDVVNSFNCIFTGKY